MCSSSPIRSPNVPQIPNVPVILRRSLSKSASRYGKIRLTVGLAAFGNFHHLLGGYLVAYFSKRSLILFMPSKLPHYLRTYRRRIGLSQDEVAFLLGGQAGTTVSRHERLSRAPSLRTLLAYEVILGAPFRDLFAGTYRTIERRTRERARRLAAKMSRAAGANADARTRRKLDMLHRIATGQSSSQ